MGDRNRGLGPGRFVYRRCQRCRCLFIAEVPGDLGRYYASEGYGSVSDAEHPRLAPGERAKVEMVARFAPAKSMIEIGPGPGMFTRVAQRAGFDVTAIEMDEQYCRELESVLGVKAIQSSDPAAALSQLPPSPAIVMWHAIEHLPDPWQVLERCVERLQPGGVLAFSTPNPDSFQFRLLGRYWAHLDAPRHLQLLPYATVRSRLEAIGMRHLGTTTTDPVGVACNRLGWEFAVRIHPARHRSNMLTNMITGSISSTLLRAFAPIERRGLQGSTYTSLFVRGA
ncbi:MAG: class I SAM-dependent methyltransferase [Solirubrobacteraceae bacterium]